MLVGSGVVWLESFGGKNSDSLGAAAEGIECERLARHWPVPLHRSDESKVFVSHGKNSRSGRRFWSIGND